ncbi:MAG: DUF1292 domain-containing protein [Clostridia bacterium]|nr:DUF1292 domain-containing protein [Clostridia bacterium]
MNDNEFMLLTDEEGNEIEYELLDRIQYEGQTYAVLLPVDEDSSEPEVVILRETEEGELSGFDDGEILDAVFGIFLRGLEE